jgi:hypothetical protein
LHDERKKRLFFIKHKVIVRPSPIHPEIRLHCIDCRDLGCIMVLFLVHHRRRRRVEKRWFFSMAFSLLPQYFKMCNSARDDLVHKINNISLVMIFISLESLHFQVQTFAFSFAFFYFAFVRSYDESEYVNISFIAEVCFQCVKCIDFALIFIIIPCTWNLSAQSWSVEHIMIQQNTMSAFSCHFS